MFKLQGWVEQGNTLVSTGGLVSTNVVQGSFPSCTVTVYIHGSIVLASIFSDDNPSPTPLANPFTSNADGSWGFYADTGRYDVVFSGGDLPAPYTLSDLTNGAGGGTGNVTGPGSAVDGDIAAFDGTSGLIIKDGGKLASKVVISPVAGTAGHIVIYDSSSGQTVRDGGTGVTGLVSGPASAVNGHVAIFNGTGGNRISDGGALSAGGFVQVGEVTLTTGNLSTNNTSPTNVTGGVVTITTGAHRCLVNVILAGKSASANEYVFIYLAIDGTRVPSSTGQLGFIHGTDSQCNISFLTAVLSAASHTFQLQFAGTNGAVLSTVYAQTANPLILQVLETSLTS